MEHSARLLAVTEVGVPLLSAEGGDVEHDQRIIADDVQKGPGLKGFQTLPCQAHGERAAQPPGIQDGGAHHTTAG